MLLESRNSNLPNLFTDLAQKLFAQFIVPEELGEALREKVSVEGESLEELAREWTNTLLSLLAIQKMAFQRCQITELRTKEHEPYLIRAELVGELLDSHRHTLRKYPAHLACRRAKVLKTSSGYEAEVEIN